MSRQERMDMENTENTENTEPNRSCLRLSRPPTKQRTRDLIGSRSLWWSYAHCHSFRFLHTRQVLNPHCRNDVEINRWDSATGPPSLRFDWILAKAFFRILLQSFVEHYFDIKVESLLTRPRHRNPVPGARINRSFMMAWKCVDGEGDRLKGKYWTKASLCDRFVGFRNLNHSHHVDVEHQLQTVVGKGMRTTAK